MGLQHQSDGDMGFTGFASRINPIALKPSLLSNAFNVRMDRGSVRPRKGIKRLTDNTLLDEIICGATAFVDAEGNDNIILVAVDGIFVYTPPQNGLAATISAKKPFPAGRIIYTSNDLITAGGDYITTNDTFRIGVGGFSTAGEEAGELYIFRGRTDAPVLTGTFSSSAIADGATGTITVTTTQPHGYVSGDEVTFHTTHTTGGAQNLNNNYVITTTGLNTYTFSFFNNTGGNLSNQNNIACTSQQGFPPLYWDGSSANVTVMPQTVPAHLGAGNCSMPPGDFGLVFQNRMVVAYKRNRLAVSDILDYGTFDLALNNFYVNTGNNDSIVGVLPWIENQFLVFMQKSIYICFIETSNFTVGSAPGVNSTITLVTSEIGCLSRRTIVTAGQFVFFLSNKGVHMLTPQLDLKLIGNTDPLSNSIDDYFQRINYGYVRFAFATYFNNRFWIALPLDDATTNTTLLVYNTLNSAWESVDTFPNGMCVDEMIVAQYNLSKRLYLIKYFFGDSEFGGVYLHEELEAGDQYSGLDGTPVLPFYLTETGPIITETAPQTEPVQARCITRQYTFNTLNEKFFSRAEVVAEAFNVNDRVKLFASTKNLDTTNEVGEMQFASITDQTYRARVALRGYSMLMDLRFTSGQPELRAVTVTGAVSNRPMISQS